MFWLLAVSSSPGPSSKLLFLLPLSTMVELVVEVFEGFSRPFGIGVVPRVASAVRFEAGVWKKFDAGRFMAVPASSPTGFAGVDSGGEDVAPMEEGSAMCFSHPESIWALI
jgi:hypothetical protein